MYNSSKGNNSGSFSGSKPTESPTGPGSRFQNKNLNSSLKAPAATNYSKPGLAVIRGSKGVGKSIGGAAAPTATLAPVPLNTPSIKRENNGHDPNVNIVQSHSSGGVWGHGSSSSGGAETSPAERPSAQPVSSLSKPAPWAKSASTASAGESTPTTNADSSTAKLSSVARPQTSNWADVDIDSDEDDAPRAPVSRVLGAVQAGANRPAEPQTGFGYNNAFNPNSNDYRKDRSGSGSFNNEGDRRFGGFGSNSGYPAQDDRFANRGGLNSGDARFNSQPNSGDFGNRNNFNNGPYNNNGFGQSPAMRNNNNSNNNNFPPRGGPVGGFGGFPNSNNGFPQGQRPPVGDFSRPSGPYGLAPAQGHFPNSSNAPLGGGNGGTSRLDPEQQRIEEARNEAQELEAKRLRKRTMSEDYAAGGNAPASASASAGMSGTGASSAAAGAMPSHQAQNSALGSFGMPASADQRDGGFHQGRRDYTSQGYPQGQGQAPGQGPSDSRWGGRDYNTHNNFSGNNFFQNNGNEGHSSGGYGSGGADFQQRPYRTRGPSFDNSGPDGGLRSFGGGGHAGMHGGQQQFPGEQYNNEPMWERVKVPPPVQQQRAQQPYNAEPASDRWGARQGLPPPPMLHYASNPSNPAATGLTMPPAGYRPERERGPRSGNTPREGEADRAAAPRTAGPAPGATAACPAVSAQSQYDPSKPFSSLFGGKSAAEAAHQAQSQGQNHHGALSQLDYPLPHEESARAARGNFSASSEQQSRPVGYDQEHRPAYPSAAGPAGGPRPKMLYDPQSNEYRTLERDTPKASYSAKAPEKKVPRATGPPASEDVVDEKASARKSLQVNRIEQNTEQKWARAKESAPAASNAEIVRPSRHVAAAEGHDENETHEQGREAYLAERKALRQKERDERGPRTKGFLFKFNAEGAVERVLTAEELEAKQRKLDRAANKAPKRTEAVELPSYDHLDFDHLTKEEFQALPKAKKDEIRAKHQAEKAARRAEPREARQDTRRSQYASEHVDDLPAVENLSIVGHKVPSSAASSAPCDHGDLDIQQTAWEIDAHRSQQPIKSFVPGQGYGHAVPSVPLPHEMPMQNWREGAQVIPAARIEQQSHLHHQQQSYQTIVQPHSYQPIIHQPVLNHAPAQQTWNYSSYAGVSEPALYGGNTSFLGQQESTVGQIFSALQSLRPENDQEITESYETREARDHYKGAGNGAIARSERPTPRGGRDGEEPTEAREYGGRGGGRGSTGGRGKTDKFERFERPRRSDEDQDARVSSYEPREGKGGRGRGGRGAGRGPPAEHEEGEGSARPASTYAGRGGRGEARGEGRGEGRGGRGGRGGREYKPRAGPPSEPVTA